MDCLASLALHAVASTSSFETAVTPRVHRRPRARLPRLTSPLPSHPPSYERPTEVARRSTPQVARAVDFLADADGTIRLTCVQGEVVVRKFYSNCERLPSKTRSPGNGPYPVSQALPEKYHLKGERSLQFLRGFRHATLRS